MNSQRIAKKQGGVVLLEGLIAITIFAFGILAIVGIQASTTRAAGDAKYRIDASFLVSQKIGEIWADRDNPQAHVKTDEPFTALPNGKYSVAISGTKPDLTVTVTVSWQAPGESRAHTHMSTTRING